MYTDGKIIIERKNLIIELTTEKSTITYLFRTQVEADNTFITLIKVYEEISN